MTTRGYVSGNVTNYFKHKTTVVVKSEFFKYKMCFFSCQLESAPDMEFSTVF